MLTQRTNKTAPTYALDLPSTSPVLNLAKAPPIIFLYGLAGAGKDHTAFLIHRFTGWPIYRADVDITDAMRSARDEKKTFDPWMRDEYFDIVAWRISQLSKDHSRLIVTQAAYKIEHRNRLAATIPGMDLIWINATDELITGRLLHRGDSVTPEYAGRMRLNFESPPVGSKVIFNSGGNEDIIRQLNGLYADNSPITESTGLRS